MIILTHSSNDPSYELGLNNEFEFEFFVFNATFSNISVISWRPVLVVEEAGENHRPWAKQLVNFITCGCESSAPFFVIYKAGREPTPYW